MYSLLQNVQFTIYLLQNVRFAVNLLQNVRFAAVCCKLFAERAVCCSLLANAAILLQNARFVRIAKDHIRPPRSYGSRQFAANRNNQPKKNFPDVTRLTKKNKLWKWEEE